jgi:hypothetical protein
VPWARLLHRVWRVDILGCVGSGGRFVLLDVVEPDAIGDVA